MSLQKELSEMSVAELVGEAVRTSTKDTVVEVIAKLVKVVDELERRIAQK